MISVNWRRGLFRIWIAASVVWLVGAGAVMQSGIRRDVSTLSRHAGEEPLSAAVNKRVYELMEATKQAKAALDLEAVEAYERDLSELAESLVVNAEERIKRKQRAAQYSLMLSASLLFLPPILLFALGWAGLWILRGFRR